MRAIILAQGKQERLSGLACPKQVLEVAGEAIVARTARILIELGVRPVLLVGWSTIWGHMKQHGVACHELADPGLCILDGIAESEGLWYWSGDELLFVLGDVVFSRSALEDIVYSPVNSGFLFAATPDLGRGSGEVFTLKTGCNTAPDLVDLLKEVPCRSEHGSIQSEPYAKYQCGHLRNLLWHIMERRGLMPDSHPAEYHSSLVLPIADWTDDVDTYNDVAGLDDLSLRVLADRRARANDFCKDIR